MKGHLIDRGKKSLAGVGGGWHSGWVLLANARYRRVLASAALRRALVLGFLVRMPIFAGGIPRSSGRPPVRSSGFP